MKKCSKVMKRCLATLLTAVMVVSVLPTNLVRAASYDDEVEPWGEVDYYNDEDWLRVFEDDDPMGQERLLDDVRYNKIYTIAGYPHHVYLFKTADQNYIIDAFHEDDGGEFALYEKGNKNHLNVSSREPGGRFLLKDGKLYLLAGNGRAEEMNFEYKDLIHNVQVIDGKNPEITELPTGGYAVTVPEGTSILLDGEEKGSGTYYIPESGKDDEKQAAKDEVKKDADEAKQEVDKIPNLSDTEKADAKKEITDAADNADKKIDAATTKTEVNNAVSDAEKTMNNAVSKAEQLAKDNAAKEDQNKKTADSFIKDNLTDEDGKIITTVTEKNIIYILNAKEKWDSLSQDVKNMINQLLQAAGGQSFDTLYNAAVTQSQKLDQNLNDNFDAGTLVATAKSSNTSTKLTWKKVAGADGYFVYTNICNTNEKKNKLKKVKDITSASKTSYKKTKLKKNKWYKYRIVAYKMVNGKKMAIGQSLLLHAYTGTKTSKLANPSKITVKKKTINVKLKKTAKMNAKLVMPKGKKLKKHTNQIRYIVSNPDIVTVNKKGKIKAKKKGTCTVYACAQNGVYKAVKVKVK
ncbi:MAG: DUF1542 domain-containing protein [Lachnospiraceae bacterium]|nr:DUF1542 domain-containing protein [Lachnospiraceae bacterium]